MYVTLYVIGTQRESFVKPLRLSSMKTCLTGKLLFAKRYAISSRMLSLCLSYTIVTLSDWDSSDNEAMCHDLIQ